MAAFVMTQSDADYVNAAITELPVTLEQLEALIAYFEPLAQKRAEIIRVTESNKANLESFKAFLTDAGFAADNPVIQAMDGAILAFSGLLTQAKGG